jgi:hypothetical protein
MLFIKKGTNQVQTTSSQTATKQTKSITFKFKIGEEAFYIAPNVYKSIGRRIATITDANSINGNNFYIIELEGGEQRSRIKEADLEKLDTLQKGQPAMPIPNVATVIKDELPKERKKFVSMDFQPFLQNWVTSNLTNAVNMDKKNIIEETVKDYIINVEAIDKNQNITFDKEAEILDKIDNYIN